LRRKTAICPEFAKKKAKLSRLCEEKRQNIPICGVLVGLRWRSLSELGCDEIQNFNTTNVVLNLILLATLSVKVAGGEDRNLRRTEKFSAEKRQFVPSLRRKKLNYPDFAKKNAKMSRFAVF